MPETSSAKWTEVPGAQTGAFGSSAPEAQACDASVSARAASATRVAPTLKETELKPRPGSLGPRGLSLQFLTAPGFRMSAVSAPTGAEGAGSCGSPHLADHHPTRQRTGPWGPGLVPVTSLHVCTAGGRDAERPGDTRGGSRAHRPVTWGQAPRAHTGSPWHFPVKLPSG